MVLIGCFFLFFTAIVNVEPYGRFLPTLSSKCGAIQLKLAEYSEPIPPGGEGWA